MEYSAMESLALEAEKLQEEFDEMCSGLSTLIENMDGQWQGKAQTEFAASYRTLKRKLDAISIVLGKYSVEIRKIADNQQETERENANSVREFSIKEYGMPIK